MTNLQKPTTSHQQLDNTDFAQWLTQATVLLKQGTFDELDIENLVEEVEDLGKRDRRVLCSNLEIVLLHLLKWQFQPEQRSASWRGAIREHRRRILRILKDSPSLNTYLQQEYKHCYVEARLQVADETALLLATLPTDCPFAIEQALNGEFLPDKD